MINTVTHFINITGNNIATQKKLIWIIVLRWINHIGKRYEYLESIWKRNTIHSTNKKHLIKKFNTNNKNNIANNIYKIKTI